MRMSTAVVLVFGISAITSPAAAVTVGELDSFSASAEGWFAGGGPMGSFPPTPPAVISSGGPAGAGDAYLQVTSSGSAGPGSRLVTNNASQWTGDYIAAGVDAIEMDLRNFGTTDLSIRLLFEDPVGGVPENVAVTTIGAFLPAGGDWTRVRFAIAPADLTAIEGDATEALAGTTFFRLFHGATAEFPPAVIAAEMGIDNITAVPEPGSWLMLAAGLLLVCERARRARSR